MATNLITKKVATDVAVPLMEKFLDIFRKDEEILIEWTSPNYTRTSMLWGLWETEKGERKTFRVKGKPGFVQAVLRELNDNGSTNFLNNKA